MAQANERERAAREAAEYAAACRKVEVPNIRLSIRKESDEWILTTIKGNYRNEYTETDPAELLRTAEELLTDKTCASCGAPLWQVHGNVVCSRHWHHYPQPAEALETHKVDCRYRPFYRTLAPAYALPAIEPGSYNGYKPVAPPELRARQAGWRKFNKMVKELMEVVETTAPDGRRMIDARWRATDAVDARRLLGCTTNRKRRKPAPTQEERYAAIKSRCAHIPSGNGKPIKCNPDGSTIGDGCPICASIGQARCPDHYKPFA